MRLLMSISFVALLSSLNIVVGKTPRSCSGITQASDISEDFKAEKKVLKYAENKPFKNVALRHHIEMLFATRTFTAEHNEILIKGLLQIVYASQVVINQKIVQNGYSKFGQVGGSLKFYSIMSACRQFIPTKELKKMYDNLQHFVRLMRSQDQILEHQFDDKHIMNVNPEGMTPPEQLVEYRRRAIVINGPSIVADHEYRVDQRIYSAELRTSKKDAMAERKNEKEAVELDRAKKFIARHDKKLSDDAKRAMAKLLADEDKEKKNAERNLVKGMDPITRKEYKVKQAHQRIAEAKIAERPINIDDE